MTIEDPTPEAGRPVSPPGPAGRRRPLVERIGIALVALAMAAMFALLGIAAWAGGEGFLAIMAGLGALMTGWAGFGGARRG